MRTNKTIITAKAILRIAEELVSDQFLMLVIGVPGSGKSTYAKTVPNAVVFEADDFFIQDGVYIYDRSKIGQAHKWCQEQVKNALKSGKNVVVSNTGTKRWERQVYYDIAKSFGAKIKVKTMTGNYNNIHGVPEEALAKMKSNFEPVNSSEISENEIEIIP